MDGLLDEMKKALSEQILDAELEDRLGKEALESGGNRRPSQKTVLGGTSKLTISVPGDLPPIGALQTATYSFTFAGM